PRNARTTAARERPAPNDTLSRTATVPNRTPHIAWGRARRGTGPARVDATPRYRHPALRQRDVDRRLRTLAAPLELDAQRPVGPHQWVRRRLAASGHLVELQLEHLQPTPVGEQPQRDLRGGLDAQVQLDRVARTIHLLDVDRRPLELDVTTYLHRSTPQGGARPRDGEAPAAVVRRGRPVDVDVAHEGVPAGFELGQRELERDEHVPMRDDVEGHGRH